ncbi:MAG: DUF1285 domain-containing protein [Deltaproteobacteria bacterium]|nr:DUF1285 domain-containing protein [Deltaproteobacteria bacterium]
MKPGDHPEFFRLPPPEGRSRESSIVLDRHGRFFHEGAPVEHAGLAAAFASWVARHPDDGRYVLVNGYDWCYLTVESTPFFVVRFDPASGEVELSDGGRERLDAETLHVEVDGVLCVSVKERRYEARFSRSAQLSIAPLLDDTEPVELNLFGQRFPVPQ